MRFLLCAALLTLSTPLFSDAPSPKTFLSPIDLQNVKAAVQQGREPWSSAYQDLLTKAEGFLSQQPLSVTFEGKSSNRYYTEKPYCGWPDGCRDGQINPDADRSDYDSAILVGRSVRTLALAYEFTADARFAEKARQLIYVWAIDPVTAMEPTVAANNAIELFITIPALVYGTDLLRSYPDWPIAEQAAFSSWLETLGEDAVSRPDYANNWQNWKNVLVGAIGSYLDRGDMIETAVNSHLNILPSQIGSDGRMLKEIGRTTSLSYSLYALNAMIQLAELARNRGIELYDAERSGRSISLALDFHVPYVLGSAAWPYEQIKALKSNDNLAMFELAYSRYRADSYLAVVNKWGRPMDEIRTLGNTTLTHGELWKLSASVPNPPTIQSR